MKFYSLHKKVLIAFLALSLLPLAVLGFYAARNLSSVEQYLRKSASSALEAQATRSLVLSAQTVADTVSIFLRSIENDLNSFVLLEPQESEYRDFYDRHRGTVRFWDNGSEKFHDVPLYSELAFIRPDGTEQIRLVDGFPVKELRNVSVPANTTYKTEDYFIRTLELPDGEVYVSRVSGWFIHKKEVEKKGSDTQYDGVVRFARAVYDKDGSLKGVAVISLDHMHLMEFTRHISPDGKDSSKKASYESADYSFMFDDEGWIITHPKQWDIRGHNSDGTLSGTRGEYSAARLQEGDIPFNLFKTGFIHENYPAAASDVLGGGRGVVDVTNVGGSRKIMAYAPIRYSSGVYAEHGVFGGVTIGAEISRFHMPAVRISDVIRGELDKFISSMAIFVTIMAVAVLAVAYRLSWSITNPIERLNLAIKSVTRDGAAPNVDVSGGDEVAQLTRSFNDMARELENRRVSLMESMQKLEASREAVIREQNFKTTVFENIETGILTLDKDNRITFINKPAMTILRLPKSAEGGFLDEALAHKSEVINVIREFQSEGRTKRWSRYIDSEDGGRNMHLRIAGLPMVMEHADGNIITVEDLTERVGLRRQMARMDRFASMGRLSAGLAHEIRNPLTGISLMLDDLHDRLLKNDADRQLIQRSLKEIERLEGLVDGLLNFASAVPPKLRTANIADILSDTLFFVKKQCERQKIILETDVEADLPMLNLDPDKIKQAFLNLLTNALDAMKNGGSLRIAVKRAEGGIELIFSDTGVGISPEDLPNIFEPFYTTKAEGTGLGLAITHNIVSEHGGKIEAESRHGAGSRFILFFPFEGNPG
ncbi:MAG: ATP-binding protein [Deferribacterales bacterium]